MPANLGTSEIGRLAKGGGGQEDCIRHTTPMISQQNCPAYGPVPMTLEYSKRACDLPETLQLQKRSNLSTVTVCPLENGPLDGGRAHQCQRLACVCVCFW